MDTHVAEVRPHVTPMPGTEAFTLQTGGSARIRVIKPDGQAPTIKFRVSGVPGHTHNACAVASVLVDLERKRGFTHTFTDAWGFEEIDFKANELGDSAEVPDADARFDHAIERGVQSITIVPENCHQEIREPARAIAEVRQLVTPLDKLRTMTYVEEVGGFVEAEGSHVPNAAREPYISDFPDIYVDMLGPVDVNNAEVDAVTQEGGVAVTRWTGDIISTPCMVSAKASHRAEDGTGTGFRFVILRDDNGSIGTVSGSEWDGVVRFRWVQGEKLYRSESFTVTFTKTMEVGPRPTAAEAFDNGNNAHSPLIVTFPSLQTQKATNGFCFLTIDNIDPQTVLLGATAANGKNYAPEIRLKNVSKPNMRGVDEYLWYGPPAYRVLVGGSYALSGPSRINVDGGLLSNVFDKLRNMQPKKLVQHLAERFAALTADDAAWVQGQGEDHTGTLGSHLYKYGMWFGAAEAHVNAPAFAVAALGLDLEKQRRIFPVAGLPRNSFKGSTWYPLSDPYPPVVVSQNMLAAATLGYEALTGQELVQRQTGTATYDNDNFATVWIAEDGMNFNMNSQAFSKSFVEEGIVPPGIFAQGAEFVEAWKTGNGQFDLVNCNETQQTARETAQQGAIDAAQNDIDQQLAVLAAANLTYETRRVAHVAALAAYTANPGAATLLALQNAQAALVVAQGALETAHVDLAPLYPALSLQNDAMVALQQLRIPPFDNYYLRHHSYTGRVRVKFDCGIGLGQVVNNMLSQFQDPTKINQMAMSARLVATYYTSDVQDFSYNHFNGNVEHDAVPEYTTAFVLLLDVEDGYGSETGTEHQVIASGSLTTVYDLDHYTAADATEQNWFVRSIDLPPDHRADLAHATAQNAPQNDIDALRALVVGEAGQFRHIGVGNVLEFKQPGASSDHHPVLLSFGNVDGNAEMVLEDFVIGFETPRVFFVSFNDIGRKSAKLPPTVNYFSTTDCVTEAQEANGTVHMCTRINKLYNSAGALVMPVDLTYHVNNHSPNHAIAICQLGPKFQDLWFGPEVGDPGIFTSVFSAMNTESNKLGPVFRSQRRISQHMCAPILNPNARLGCSAPLNYETRHLPPELRDFQMRLDGVDWSFLPGKVTMEPLTTYEFNGGNQVSAAHDNLLHLPQFREGSTDQLSASGAFDFEVFSPYGMPSYIAVFSRDQDFSRIHMTQPIVKQLSIMCNTTMKRSNTILNADVHQLYHLTQRNVHPRAEYDRHAFNKRQVVLLRAEDIGMLGLHASEYQYEKRAVFRFQGTVDQQTRVTALLIFNNRGLYVHGKQLSVERLVR